ncbi:MAG: hypothetical protein J6S60_07320 [Oscillospiraceae bacterium]|nr:hypothetical protein [Oscillospiraceae bacterium]
MAKQSFSEWSKQKKAEANVTVSGKTFAEFTAQKRQQKALADYETDLVPRSSDYLSATKNLSRYARENNALMQLAMEMAAENPASTTETYRMPENPTGWDYVAKTQKEATDAFGKTRMGLTIGGGIQSAGAGYANAPATINDYINQYYAAPTVFNPDGTVNWEASVAAHKPSETVQTAVDRAQKRADDLQTGAAEQIAAAKDGLGWFGRTLVDAGVSGVQMAGDALINAVAPGAGLAAMGVRAFGNAAQDARQRGADVARQVGYGAAVAGVEVLSEKMFDGLAGIYGKGATDDIVEKVIGKMANSEGGRRVLKWLSSGLGEAAEEWVAGALDPALESIIDGERIGSHYSPDTVTDILHDGLVGFILGGLGGAVEAATYQPGHAAQARAAEAEAEYAPQLNNAIQNAYDVMASKGMFSGEGRTAANMARQSTQRAQEMARGQYGSMRAALPTEEEYDEDTGYTFRKMGDDAVRAIIAEGMESAPGTQSRTLAEQYRARMDDGDTLTDAEIGKLYQANQDAIRDEARQNNQTVREYTSEPVNETLMRLAQEVTQTRAAAEQPMTQREALDMILNENANMGETGRKYAREIFRLTQGEDGNALDFYRSFDAVYQAARRGETAADVMNRYGDTLTPQAAQAAFNAGVEDMAARPRQAATGERYDYTVEQNDGGRYAVTVRDAEKGTEYSGGVYDTQAEADQAVKEFKKQMEGVTANVESGNENADGGARVSGREGRSGVRGRAETSAERRATRERAAEDIRNSVDSAKDGEEVSSREAGISGGTDETSMRLVRNYRDAEMREIEADAAKNGVKVEFFLGEIRAMKGGKKIAARGEYSADGKTFFIALDDPDFTARQIYDHEDFHARSHNDAELQEVAAGIIESHSAAELREMVRAYVNAYGWTNMTNEDIVQEILADAYAGIDIFMGRDVFEGATRFTEDVRGAVKAREGEQQKTRGPPSEVKLSEKLTHDSEGRELTPEQQNQIDGIIYTDDDITDSGLIRNFENRDIVVDAVEKHLESSGKYDDVYVEKSRGMGSYETFYITVEPKSMDGDSITIRYSGHSGRDGGNDAYLWNKDYETLPQLLDAIDKTIENVVRKYSGAQFSQKITSQQDADYAAAVERGDMETAQKMVDEAAERAMPESKVRTPDGKLMPIYHGTKADFTVFDTKGHGGANGTAEGYGIYLTDMPIVASAYGDRKIAGYADVKRPAYGDRKTIKRSELARLVKAICMQEAQRMVAEDDYASVKEALPDTWVSNYVYTPDYPSMSAVYSDVADHLLRQEDNDADVVYEIMNALGIRDYERAMDFYHDILTPTTGIDGIWQKWKVGKQGAYANIILAFSSNQIKSNDPVTYDDAGNVIPLSERFNPENEDIRFSQKLTAEDELRRQNEDLKQRVEYWKSQTKRTTVPTARADDAVKEARKLVKAYDSATDANEIGAALKDLTDYIMRGEDVTYSDVKDRAVAIARELVENAEALREGDGETFREVRDALQKPLIISAQDAHDVTPDGWGDYRNSIRSKVNVSINGKGTPIDTAYKQLSERFPSLFPEEITHPADQLQHMVDVIDELTPVFENPFSYNMAEAIEYCANDIIDRVLGEDIRQTPPTFADRAAARLAAEKARGAQKAAQVREQKNAQIAALKERNAAATAKALARVRESRDRQIAALKEHYAEQKSKASENRKARALRNKIAQHVKDLSAELLRPTDKHHIPEALRGPVARLLESINLESGFDIAPTEEGKTRRVERGQGAATKRTQAFAALKEVYARIGSEMAVDPDLMGDGQNPGLLDDIAAIGNKPLANMTSEELETVWNAVRAIEASVRTWNKLFTAGRWETVTDMADTLRNENQGKKQKQELRGALGRGQNLLTLDMKTPETYFSNLGDTGRTMFRMLRDAQDKQITLWDAAIKRIEDVIGDYDVREAEKRTVEVEIAGQKVTATRAQLMELYALMRREQALAHLQGGVQFSPVQKGVKRVTMPDAVRLTTLEDLSKAVQLLAPEEVRIAEALQEFLSTTVSDWGNEASMSVYGYKKFGEKNYWPIRVNRHDVQSSIEGETGQRSVKNYGFAKALTPNAKNSVIIGSIFDTFANHVAEMATYSAFLEASEDLMRVFNYQFKNDAGERTGTVKGLVNQIHGTGGTSYFMNLMQQLAFGVKGENIGTEYMGGLVGNYKASAIGANLRVFLQQPTAIIRASELINPAYLTAGLKNPIAGWKKAERYAPIALWKSWGYFDMAAGRSLKSLMFDSESKLQKANSALMAPAGWMDSFAWGQLWNACEMEAKAKIKSGELDVQAGSKAFYETVAQRFTEIIDHTQVVDGILQRSQVMRSADGIKKMATSFMAEPIKQYNQLVSAVDEVRYSSGEKRKAAKARLARAAVSLVAASTANAMVKSVVDAMRSDDRKKKYWERWLDEFKGNLTDELNPLTYIPYVKDAWSIVQGYSVDRMDMETIGSIISASRRMIKALNGEGQISVANAVASLTAEISRLVGVPVANVKRDILGMLNTVATETDNYVMQYELDKVLYNVGSNKARFSAILYEAYKSDPEQYKIIYNGLRADGLDDNYLRSSIEDRMKKDKGVNSVKELDQRWMSPTQQTRYDTVLEDVTKSKLWRGATEEQKSTLEDKLYALAAETTAGETYRDKIDGGASVGLSDGEYMLYLLALDMADQGTSGSYTNDEVETAIKNVPGLTDKERSYLWQAQGKNAKNNPWAK